jgi:hypothetical protein
MSIQTAYSTKPLPDAVTELRGDLRGAAPRVVLFFASTDYDAAAVSEQLQRAFPGACVAGCSTAGEIAGGKMLRGSIVAMFLDDEIVEDAAAVVVENLGSGTGLAAPFAALEAHFRTPAATWNFEKYVGLVLVDGLSGAEERLMEKLGDSTEVFFVGGSAGDDLKFKGTHVCAGGRTYSDSAVLVLMRLRGGFEIVKTQSFQSTGRSLVATAVDEARRMVIEFDHKPALEAYAETLGVPYTEAAGRFFEHPLGLMMKGEPFIRSPQRANGGSIVFYCQIKKGMQLEVLQATDIVADTRRLIEAQKAAEGEIRGIIDFHCILRALQLRKENRCDQYAAIFNGIPMVGFSTYGEAYLGHLNQTSTILLFR